MALIINTNNYAVTAQTNLAIANNSLARSIERLSSGLRINHAADDASGLAISEKLRGQINGLAKASMNSQDAISLLQTAEGGMEVIADMLQRMRELAVQAGNGTYTANDRRELQKEVDQLKSEVDRISSSTEFNTKKLLTGQAAGLWSSDSGDVDVVINSVPMEGNYKLTFDVAPGLNAVYKTDIMAVNSDIVLEKKGANGTSLRNFNATGNILSLDEAMLSFRSYTVAPTIATSVQSVAFFRQEAAVPGSGTGGYKYSSGVTVNVSGTVSSGYVEIEFLSSQTVVNSAVVSNIRVTFVDAASGVSYSKEQSLYVVAAGNVSGVYTFDNGMKINVSMLTTVAPFYSGTKVIAGDKMLFSVQAGVNSTNFTLADDTLAAVTIPSIGTTITQGAATAPDWPVHAVSTAVITGPAVILQNGKTQGGQITAVTIDNGKFQVSTIRFDKDYSVNGFISGTVTLDAFAKGTVAASNVKLKDIGLFTNADGRMLLDNTQYLDIYGNDGMATVTIEGDDTIDDFVNKLRAALESLNMSADVQLSDLIRYIEPGAQSSSGNNAVPGTIVIQSALTGEQSDIRFVADENVLNALSIAQIQKSVPSMVKITVKDAHTGDLVGSDTVSDYRLRGIIPGADVRFRANIGITAYYDQSYDKMLFKPIQYDDVYVHIVSKPTSVQAGANEGQTLDISIGRLDCVALEISDAYVVTMEDAQKAITKFDQALEKLNHARATLGAQINRLEYTIKNLSIGKQNLIAAESRIRDLDVADESSNFAKNQILVNAAVAMLAQANQLPQTALQLINR
ncbi:flagellin [Deferribacterales bacterium RsTz2092]|nr:flagellin [Deferribacterales bacterium]